jgi:hypothetical protein
MKKLTALICLSLLAAAATKSFALPVAGSKALTASVTVSGGTQTWNATLKNVSDNSTPTNQSAITWSGVTAGMPGYKIADQYVELTTLITNPITWKMIVYTNNTSYAGDKSLGSFGLVNSSNNRGLPLSWKVQDSTDAVAAPVFSTTRLAPGATSYTEGFTDYQWKFLVDKTQTGTHGWSVADAASYNRVWDNSGFYWNEGIGPDMDSVKPGNQPSPTPSDDNKVNLYLGAGFTTSLAEQYTTTSLTIETLVL